MNWLEKISKESDSSVLFETEVPNYKVSVIRVGSDLKAVVEKKAVLIDDLNEDAKQRLIENVENYIQESGLFNIEDYPEGTDEPNAFSEYVWDFINTHNTALDVPDMLANDFSRIKREGSVKRKADPMDSYNVYLNGKLIDTVYYDQGMDTSEVKKSLVDHDNYDPNIVVKLDKSFNKKQSAQLTKYWVFDDATGGEKETDFDEFKYFHDEFGRTVMDKSGTEYSKGEIPLEQVTEVFNPQGILIARTDSYKYEGSKQAAKLTDEAQEFISKTASIKGGPVSVVHKGKVLGEFGSYEEADQFVESNMKQNNISSKEEYSVMKSRSAVGHVVTKQAAKLTDEAQEFISKKIEKLREEGKEEAEAAAIAYDMARKEGYDVPEKKESSKRIASLERIILPDTEEEFLSLYPNVKFVYSDPYEDYALKSQTYGDAVRETVKEVPGEGYLYPVLFVEDFIAETYRKAAESSYVPEKKEGAAEFEEDTEPFFGDYIMSSTGPLGSKTLVSHEDIVLGEFDSEEEAEQFIKSDMEKTQIYADVWIQDDHGGYTKRTIASLPNNKELRNVEGKYTGDMEKDLQVIIPEVIADQVTGGDKEASDWLVDRAKTIYRNNPDWGKKLSSEGNSSRDFLYSFMEHWFKSYKNKKTSSKKVTALEPGTYEITPEEIILLIENEKPLYDRLVLMYQNLSKKKQKGIYDPTLAPKMFKYLADDGAKLWYDRMVKWADYPGDRVIKPSVQVRQQAAEQMARAFEQVYEDQEYDFMKHTSSLRGIRMGDEVVVSEGSGLDSGKKGVVISWSEIPFDGRGIPQIPGYFKAPDRNNDLPIRFEDGDMGILPANYVTQIKDEAKLIQESSGITAEKYKFTEEARNFVAGKINTFMNQGMDMDKAIAEAYKAAEAEGYGIPDERMTSSSKVITAEDLNLHLLDNDTILDENNNEISLEAVAERAVECALNSK